MDIQTLEKVNGELKTQNRKRNMVIAGFMTAGAISGFLIARQLKGKALAQVLSVVGGSLVFGLPVLFLTRKKQQERRKKIEENNIEIQKLQAGSNAVVSLITDVINPKSQTEQKQNADGDDYDSCGTKMKDGQVALNTMV